MKAMLTSFGIEHLPQKNADTRSVFYRMPPVSFGSTRQPFTPDFELLLLCDQVVMDELSFHRLVEHPAPAYAEVSLLFGELRREGRVSLVDYHQILRENAVLLDKMIEHDLKSIGQWISPLRDSLAVWRRFVRDAMNVAFASSPGKPVCQFLHQDVPHDEILLAPETHWSAHSMHDSATAALFHARSYEEVLEGLNDWQTGGRRHALLKVLESYLRYVNANLVLSNQIDVAFHDWQDFIPFYSLKFLGVGQDGLEPEKRRAELVQLFAVPFPDLTIRSPRALLKALDDRRIEDLRGLVDDAVAGKEEFDNEFAKRILTEVLGAEKQARKWRSVVGYATAPVGFIPWVGTPVQKLLEELVGSTFEKKVKEKHRWYYMLSSIAEQEGKKD